MLGIVKKATISILILLALLIGGRTIYKLYKAPTTETQPNEKERDWGDIHQDFKNNPELIEEWEKENEEEIKTIDKVIQNITDGSGKSTLANVLLNKNGNFEEVFKTSHSGISETEKVQTAEFVEDGVNYRIIDTVGIFDNRLTQEELIEKIVYAVAATVPSGISRILFVHSGYFSQYEIEAYNLLKKVIFGADIVPFTTMVRTGFVSFENEEKCQELYQKSTNEEHVRSEVAEIFQRQRRYTEISKEKREISRQKLLSHLATCQDTYHPTNLDNLKERIDKFMTREKLKRDGGNSNTFKNNLENDLKAKFEKTEKELAEKQQAEELEKKKKELEEQKKDQENPEIAQLTALKNQTKDFFRNLEKMCENGFPKLLTNDDYNGLIIAIKANKRIIKSLMLSQSGPTIIRAADDPNSPSNDELKELKLSEEYYNLIEQYFEEAKAEVKKQNREEKTELVNNKNGNLGTILFSRTKKGKSTLANILSGTNEFEESKSGSSNTKEIQIKDFEVEVNNKNVKYKVIDTVGFDDTCLSHYEVLEKTKEACNEIKDGLSQIFFVTRLGFIKQEFDTFNKLKNTIFGENIGNYTTIIRTNFEDFEDEEECKKETKKMKDEIPGFTELLAECNGIIYVDNPVLSITGNKKRVEAQITLNRETRELSRKKLLDHLIYNCGDYHPVSLEGMVGRISSFLTEKERLEKEIEDLRKADEKNRKLSREERIKASEKEQELQAQIEVLTKDRIEIGKIHEGSIEASLEVINDKVLIPLKIKKLGSHSEKGENGNELGSLDVYNNYEIITPNKTIVFANSFKKEKEANNKTTKYTEVDAEETNNGKEEEDKEQENKQEEIKETCPHCQEEKTDQTIGKTNRKNNPKEKKLKNYYDILEVKKDASEEEIKAAYKRMSRKYHPDKATKNGLTTEEATEKFQELHTAYEELTEQVQKQARRKKLSSQTGIIALFVIVEFTNLDNSISLRFSA
ncbi:13457_t:CDS:10 [Entrophospora sp. SA101]|nr:13457_t:CDS:10 [Entrophospora sp. SA101]